MIALVFVPCYRFKTADTGLNKSISLITVMSNGWDKVRDYLFGGGETEKVVSDFSWALLLIIIAFVALFAVGLIFAVYSCARLISYFSNGDRDSQPNVLFITVVPNRIVLCLYHALVLPLFALPLLMPVLYDKFLYYHVELFYDPFDMLWIALGLYALTVAVIAVSAYLEKKAGMDIFAKREAPVMKNGESQERTVQSDAEDVYTQMNDAAKKEQMERILRLLNKDTKEEDK